MKHNQPSLEQEYNVFILGKDSPMIQENFKSTMERNKSLYPKKSATLLVDELNQDFSAWFYRMCQILDLDRATAIFDAYDRFFEYGVPRLVGGHGHKRAPTDSELFTHVASVRKEFDLGFRQALTAELKNPFAAISPDPTKNDFLGTINGYLKRVKNGGKIVVSNTDIKSPRDLFSPTKRRFLYEKDTIDLEQSLRRQSLCDIPTHDKNKDNTNAGRGGLKRSQSA